MTQEEALIYARGLCEEMAQCGVDKAADASHVLDAMARSLAERRARRRSNSAAQRGRVR